MAPRTARDGKPRGVLRLSRASGVLLASAVIIAAGHVRAEDARPAGPRLSPVAAAGIWAVAQLVPSPLLVTGSNHVGGGVRWQITPFVYSFGVAAHPIRLFVVEPVARHAGAVELYASPEWACCAANDATSWMGRLGLRVYLPILDYGESLSWSLGGSYYRAGDGDGIAFEAGAYTLFGVVGISVTVAPTLKRREVISALTIRYF